MQFLKTIWKKVGSFYLIVGGAALIWMLFLDQNSIIPRISSYREIRQMEKDLAFYRKETGRLEEARVVLENDPDALERFAREEFKMKKDDEDVYLIVDLYGK